MPLTTTTKIKFCSYFTKATCGFRFYCLWPCVLNKTQPLYKKVLGKYGDDNNTLYFKTSKFLSPETPQYSIFNSLLNYLSTIPNKFIKRLESCRVSLSSEYAVEISRRMKYSYEIYRGVGFFFLIELSILHFFFFSKRFFFFENLVKLYPGKSYKLTFN